MKLLNAAAIIIAMTCTNLYAEDSCKNGKDALKYINKQIYTVNARINSYTTQQGMLRAEFSDMKFNGTLTERNVRILNNKFNTLERKKVSYYPIKEDLYTQKQSLLTKYYRKCK